jgi:NAD+ kinase
MKVLVVYKKSTWELKKDSLDEDVMFYMGNYPEEVARWKESDKSQSSTLKDVVGWLNYWEIPHDAIYRAHLEPIQDDGEYDFVIAVGGDGTVLEVSRYVKNTKVLGVNSDPENSVGHFCHANASNISSYIMDFKRSDPFETIALNRIKITRNGHEIPELALNEVFISHSNPSAMSRYSVNGEKFKSSGHLLSTAAGSTAFIKNAGGIEMSAHSDGLQGMPIVVKDAAYNFYDNPVHIVSHMREGKIWIDGEHVEYDFPMGSEIICESGTPLNLVA